MGFTQELQGTERGTEKVNLNVKTWTFSKETGKMEN